MLLGKLISQSVYQCIFYLLEFLGDLMFLPQKKFWNKCNFYLMMVLHLKPEAIQGWYILPGAEIHIHMFV